MDSVCLGPLLRHSRQEEQLENEMRGEGHNDHLNGSQFRTLMASPFLCAREISWTLSAESVKCSLRRWMSPGEES